MNQFSLVRLAAGFFSVLVFWGFLVVWFFGLFWVSLVFFGLVDWFFGEFLCLFLGFIWFCLNVKNLSIFHFPHFFVAILLKTNRICA